MKCNERKKVKENQAGQAVRPVSIHCVARWASSVAEWMVSLFLMCSRWDSIVLMLRFRVFAIWRVLRPSPISRGQLFGKCRTEGCNTGHCLAQTVVQLAPEPRLFLIEDLENFPLQPSLGGDVPRRGVNLPEFRYRQRVPLQQTVRAVLVAVAILKEDRFFAFAEVADLRSGRAAVVGVQNPRMAARSVHPKSIPNRSSRPRSRA